MTQFTGSRAMLTIKPFNVSSTKLMNIQISEINKEFEATLVVLLSNEFPLFCFQNFAGCRI